MLPHVTMKPVAFSNEPEWRGADLTVVNNETPQLCYVKTFPSVGSSQLADGLLHISLLWRARVLRL